MKRFDLNLLIWIEAEEPHQDELAEFLRTGRITGGPECREFLCDLFGESGRSQPILSA